MDRKHIIFLGILTAVCLVITSCLSSPTETGINPETTPVKSQVLRQSSATRDPDEEGIPTDISPTPTNVMILAGDDQGGKIWFIPNISIRIDISDQFDQLELFRSNANWVTANEMIDVFLFNIWMQDYTDREFPLKDALELLAKSDIALSVGVYPFSKNSCNGERAASRDLVRLNKFLTPQSMIKYIEIRFPINMLTAPEEDDGCSLSIDEMAGELTDYVSFMSTKFPETEFGIYDVLGGFSIGEFGQDQEVPYMGDFLELFDLLIQDLVLAGERIHFFHLDSPYDYTGGAEITGWRRIKALEDYIQSKNIKFGICLNSHGGSDESDQLYYSHVLLMLDALEKVGMEPDHLIFESYGEYPELWIPEDEPYSFTNLIVESADQVNRILDQEYDEIQRPSGSTGGGPCDDPASITTDDVGLLKEICGEVTIFGDVPCPTCPYGVYSYIVLDRVFTIISYDWFFTGEWLGDCVMVADTVEVLGGDPIFKFGKGEGYAGSECTLEEGNISCGAGDYFQFFETCP